MKFLLPKLFLTCSLLVMMLCFAQKATSQSIVNIPVKSVLDGSKGQLAKDSLAFVQDSAYLDASIRSKLDTPYTVRNIVTFSINEFSRVYLPDSFKAVITVDITYTTPSLEQYTTTQTLTINYDTSHAYTQRNSFVFNNAHAVTVKVVDLQITGGGTDVVKALQLENDMEVHPVYKLSCTADAVKTVFDNNPPYSEDLDELVVNWPVITGADEYDLEWTYIDSSALNNGRYGNPATADKIFAYNTTRVTIPGYSYAIPLLYDDGGVLYYRVRAVQRKSNYDRLETVWSSDYNGGLGAYGFYGHERSLNWQSTVNFAEDGKRKVVVQYFDGSLRGRQTVTKDNTTNTTIVGESFYDYQGRPVVQVMPAPTLNTVIKYTRNLNMGLNGAEYDKEHYDHLDSPEKFLTTAAAPMDSSSGTNQYYSGSNPLKDQGINRFIPQANGYAFSETEYTQDNTGRISRQGGVGPTFQLNSGHEAKYFYGSPSQEDLDALFGTEVGDASHYFKNMVSDANGQYAVSYVDMHGRTIATALAGYPENKSLSNIPDVDSLVVTDSLSGISKNNIEDPLSIVSHHTELVEADRLYSFYYSLMPPVLQKNDCNGNNICYTSLYDLEIKITDNAYNQYLGGHPFDTILHNYQADQILPDCTTPDSIRMAFSLYLKKGSYEVTKMLRVSKGALEYYRDSVFLKSNVCVTIDSLIEQQRLLQQHDMCFPDCKSCRDSLGDWESFLKKYVLNGGGTLDDTTQYYSQAQAAYKEAAANCDMLCSTNSEGDDIRKSMLLDMIPPSGQYANASDTTDTYSIFYQPDENTPAPYQQTSLVYLDENGNPDQVFNDVTQTFITPQQLDPDQFTAKFKSSWAEALLPFHPEYCKLQAKLQQSASDVWDKDFESIDTYGEALQKGYLNPLDVSDVSFPATNPDPFMTDAGRHQVMYNRMKKFSLINKVDYNMWSMATITVKCTDKDDESCALQYSSAEKAFAPALCSGDLDMAWRNFRNLYLNEKRKQMSAYINTSCPASSYVTPSVLKDAFKISRFTTADDASQQSGLGYMGSASQSALQDTSAVNLSKAIADNCESYVTFWMQQLAPCYSASVKQEIINKLLQVCKEGGDAEHPMGSSSVRPASVYSYRSFQQVLDAYRTNRTGDTLVCNSEMITTPAPYDMAPVVSDVTGYTRPTDCQCGKLQQLHREYVFLKRSGDADFSAFLLRTRGISINESDLNILMDACSAGSGSCSYLPKPVLIPAVIQCNTAAACTTCAVVDSLNNSFKALYPGITVSIGSDDTTQAKENAFFAAYMNNRLGYSKQAWEYMAFIDTCAHYPQTGGGTQVCEQPLNKAGVVKVYNNNGVDKIADIRLTRDSGYIMAGSTNGSGFGGVDGYVIKTDRNGNLQWAKTYGGKQDEEFARLIPTADNGYIAIGNTYSYCYAMSAILVVKMDSSGNVQWNRTVDFEDYGGKGTDIIQLSDSSYAFAGQRTSGGQNTDWVTGVFYNDGNLNWLKQTGSAVGHDRVFLAEKGDTLVAATAISNAGNYDAVIMKAAKINGARYSLDQYDLGNRGNLPNGILVSGDNFQLSVTNLADGGNTTANGGFLNINSNGDVLSAFQVSTPAVMDAQSWASIPAGLNGSFASQSSAHDTYLQYIQRNGTMGWASKITLSGNDRLYKVMQNKENNLVGAGLYNQYAMLMVAGTYGKVSCNDSLAGISMQDITALTSSRSVLAQTEVTLGSQNVNSVTVIAKSCIPAVSIVSCASPDSCYTIADGPLLCGNASPVFPTVSLDDVNSCSDSAFFATSAGTVLYNTYKDSLANDFEQAYVASALQAIGQEHFSVTHSKMEYHYTLYYYDQAGNLVKTVPPAGVQKNYRRGWIDSVDAARVTGDVLSPLHKMVTQYRYNTMNVLVSKNSPDANQHQFWYDRLGRLAVSQDAEQFKKNAYTYSLYDSLNRIRETGQLSSESQMSDEICRNETALANWINNAALTKEQITITAYDSPHDPLEKYIWNANNLRNKISWRAIYKTEKQLKEGFSRESASYYSYDILGNIKEILNEYNSGLSWDTTTLGHYKKIVYDFDLITEKVNSISYNPGLPDAFYHRFNYDAENRITDVETSKDSIYWEHDAFYQYYKHGPLARTVLGQLQVQGKDYAYTLQGWSKGINSTLLTSGSDMGNDGSSGGITARDAFGYALHFYGDQDYKPIDIATKPFADGIENGAAFKPLYDGDIAAMSVNISKIGEPLLYNYSYDALGRLVAMDAAQNLNLAQNTWAPLLVPDFGERISYDPNGNILRYDRHGNNTWAHKSLKMDSLIYNYEAESNKLSFVTDKVTDVSAYAEDIDDQPNGNYKYNLNGNLVYDNSGQVDSVYWTVYGKISRIVKHDNSVIIYKYDVGGHRISKITKNKEIRYVYDGSGNVMSEYVSGDSTINNGNFSLTEFHLYGSDRLGSAEHILDLQHVAAFPILNLGILGIAMNADFERGNKSFELNNHLGNVLAVVKDVKIANSTNNDVVDNYTAKVISATDYYPFGMPMPGRNIKGSYKYGFNGQEKSDEIDVNDNSYTADFWEYDARIGRRWNIDPVSKEYESPYACLSNSPISRMDPNGDADTASAYKAGIYTSVMEESAGRMKKLMSAIDQYQSAISTMKDYLNKGLMVDVGMIWNPMYWAPQAVADQIVGNNVDYMASKLAQRVGELQTLIQQYNSAYRDYSMAAMSLKLEFSDAKYLNVNGIITQRLGGTTKGLGTIAAIHKNSHSAEGEYKMYEIIVDGETLKFGIADAGRLRKGGDWAGLPERLAQQLAKIKKYAPELKLTYNIGKVQKVTKAEMIAKETAEILAHAKEIGIPIGNLTHIRIYAEAYGKAELSAKALEVLSKFMKL